MREPLTNRREFLTLPRSLSASAGENAEAPPGPATTAAAPEQILNRFSVRAMGCEFDVLFDGQRYSQGAEAAWAATERIQQLEAILSTYREESPVSQVNRRAAVVPVEVPDEVLEILEMSAAMFLATGGAFDVTSGPLSKAWGYYYRQPRVPSEAAIQQALSSVGFQHVHWDRNARSVSISQSGVELNFASIGKGYALDAAGAILQAAGVDEFLIQGGQSSVLARHPPNANAGWIIGVLHPLFQGLRLGTVELRNQALATSGSQRQALIHRGQRLGHILDPRTGWPATHTLSATVVSDSAAEVDALATACCLLTLDEVAALCRDRPHVGALLVRANPENAQQLVLDIFNAPLLRWTPAA